MDFLLIGFGGGLIVAAVGAGVWKFARHGLRAANPARISQASFVTSLRAVGELSVFRIMTKEVITASDHWFEEFAPEVDTSKLETLLPAPGQIREGGFQPCAVSVWE